MRYVLERTKYKSDTSYPNLGTVGPLACSPDAVTGRGISSRHDGRGHQHSVAGIAVFSAVVILGPLQVQGVLGGNGVRLRIWLIFAFDFKINSIVFSYAIPIPY